MRTLLALPFILILVVFALSNPQPVRLGIWPTDYSWEVPMSLAILIAMAAAFFIGGFVVWLSELGQRRRARRAEYTVRLLEEQVRELRGRMPGASAVPPLA